MVTYQKAQCDEAAEMPAESVKRDKFDGLAGYVAPVTSVENVVAAIWCQAFDINEVGIHIDFFDLQGDSLIATTIATEVSAEFGIEFQPSLIISYPTVSSIAKYVGREANSHRSGSDSSSFPPHLVPVRTTGSLPPLFIIHGLFGIIFPNPKFLDALDPDQPVYFLQAIGFMGEATPPRTVKKIAAAYRRTIRECWPNGPLNIVAFCSGSLIAMEIGHQLANAGDPPNILVLIDPPKLNSLNKALPVWARSAVSRVLKFPRWVRRTIFGPTGLLAPKEAPNTYFLKMLRLMASDAENIRKFSTPAAKKAHDALYHALKTHWPQPYDGHVEVITSRSRLRLFEDESLHWAQLLSDFRVHVSVEKHSDLFTGEIETIARDLQQCLSRARQEVGETSHLVRTSGGDP